MTSLSLLASDEEHPRSQVVDWYVESGACKYCDINGYTHRRGHDAREAGEMMATWTCGRMAWMACATIADCRVCETTTLGEKWKMERDVNNVFLLLFLGVVQVSILGV